MDLTYLTETKEKEPRKSNIDKSAPDFSSYMEIEEMQDSLSKPKTSLAEEDEKTDLTPENPIIHGPYTAPLFPRDSNFVFSKLITSVPLEIRPLIEPLPAAIQLAFKEGITETTMVIELASKEKVEVIIEQYDTAPNAFHISFYGSPQTGDLISQKQSMLLNTLQKTLPNFAFAISPPFLKAPSFSLPKRARLGYSPVKRGKSKQ
jgi:hypothetical protein